MPSTDGNFQEYASHLLKLHTLIREGEGDSEQADAVRDEMDESWDRLGPSDVTRVRGLSADLYTLTEEAKPATPSPSEEAVGAQLRQAEAQGNWDGALMLVRQYTSELPTQKAAFLKGVYWARLGGPDLSLPFLEHAARSEPKALPVFLLTLAQLGLFEEMARLVLAFAGSGEVNRTIPDSLVRVAHETLRLHEKLREALRESRTPVTARTGPSPLDPRQIEQELLGLQSFMAMELASSAA